MKKLVCMSILALTIFVFQLKDGFAEWTNTVPNQIENASLILHVDYSSLNTTWDINQIQTLYPDSTIVNGYLTYYKELSDYNRNLQSPHSEDLFPEGILIQFVVGQDMQTYIGADLSSEWAYALIASTNSLGRPWENLTKINADDQQIFENGYKWGIEPSVKLSTLYAIQVNEYKTWDNNGFITNPLSNIDSFLLPKARLKNNTSDTIYSIFAQIRTLWNDSEYESLFFGNIIDRWWPKGKIDDTGNAYWSFDIDVSSISSNIYSEVMVYGDVGTNQTVYFDNGIKLTHSNYGELTKREIVSNLPLSVKLEHENVWSANANHVIFTFSGQNVEFLNMLENPEVGDTPSPVKLVLPVGWTYDKEPSCIEEDTGALDIAGACGTCGGSVSIANQIQNAPNNISAGGYDVIIPDSMTYAGFTKGSLIPSNFTVDVNFVSPNIVRVGFFKTGGTEVITAGSSGTVVNLEFDLAASCSAGQLTLTNLKDDIATWTTSGGCLNLNCCPAISGDINDDGEITPGDALYAFEAYLGICPTSCGVDCETVRTCGDVNGDGDITPADALCIFQKYLDDPESCLY